MASTVHADCHCRVYEPGLVAGKKWPTDGAGVPPRFARSRFRFRALVPVTASGNIMTR